MSNSINAAVIVKEVKTEGARKEVGYKNYPKFEINIK